LLILGVVLISATLRPPITSVGPLSVEIRADTGLSAGALALITTIPLLAFAGFSPVAPRMGHRFGIELVIFASSLVLLGGILLRWLPGLVPLYVGTVAIGVAIAFGNVLVPALVKRDFPRSQGQMTALYSTALSGAGGIGSGVAIPLAHDAGLGWEGALAVWAIPTAIALAVWVPRLRERHRLKPPPGPVSALRDLWGSRVAWQVTLFMGMQSFGFYVCVAWLPAVLIEQGLSAAQAGGMLSVAQLSGLVATLSVPQLADRRSDQRVIVLGAAGAMLVGIGGLIAFGGAAPFVWVAMLGFAQGAGLALALMFFVLRAADHRAAAELSGMAQTVGYLIAAGGPLLAGLVHDLTGKWEPILWLLLGAALLQLAFGLGAARDRIVGVSDKAASG